MIRKSPFPNEFSCLCCCPLIRFDFLMHYFLFCFCMIQQNLSTLQSKLSYSNTISSHMKFRLYTFVFCHYKNVRALIENKQSILFYVKHFERCHGLFVSRNVYIQDFGDPMTKICASLPL